MAASAYAGLSTAVFALAALRRRQVQRALECGQFEHVGERAMLALTLVAMLLSFATLAIIVSQA